MMLEKTLKFAVSELTTIRLICRNERCGAVIEVPIDNLEVGRPCPICDQEFRWHGADEALTKLVDGLTYFQKTNDAPFTIQFILNTGE